MKKVIYPYRNTTNQTMFDVWNKERGEVGVLGSGSDYTSFLHRGIASLDITAGGGPTDPVYHYHSVYDSYHWMATFGDPGFVTHRSMATYLTLLLYHFVNDASLPLEPSNFAPEMKEYFKELEEHLETNNATLDLTPLTNAIATFETAASEFDALRSLAISSSNSDLIKVTNAKARDFHRGFTSQGGLPGRQFFHHLIFAPGLDTGYAPTTFPAITEAVTAGNLTLAQEWVGRTSRAILVAAGILKT